MRHGCQGRHRGTDVRDAGSAVREAGGDGLGRVDVQRSGTAVGEDIRSLLVGTDAQGTRTTEGDVSE